MCPIVLEDPVHQSGKGTMAGARCSMAAGLQLMPVHRGTRSQDSRQGQKAAVTFKVCPKQSGDWPRWMTYQEPRRFGVFM